jgi:DNA-3-methyladenine glycosylase
MHWLFNCVTEREGFPAAVLIRAVYPIQGIPTIAGNRAGQPRRHWADGPAKLCRAFEISGIHNGIDLCAPHSTLFIARGFSIPEEAVTIAPRVGLKTVPEPWRSLNFSILRGDDCDRVLENRQRLATALGLAGEVWNHPAGVTFFLYMFQDRLATRFVSRG